MNWLGKLVERGYMIETVISEQPGFKLILLVHKHTGERLLYWRRSGQITRQTVEHLRRLVKIKVDKLFIEFTDKPQITEEAENLLKQMFSEIEFKSTKDIEPERKVPKVISLYNDNIVIVKKKFTRGSIRLGEHEHLLKYLQSAENNKIWILVIKRTPNGKIVIYDDYKDNWQNYVRMVHEEGSQVIILAVWHGQDSTDLFLLYPPLEDTEST